MDDAATANWSSEWQMPSEAQFGELMNSSYTSTSSTYLNNVWGLEITSNRNGNSIFLPYAGYYDGTNLNSSRGYYWSRTLSSTMPSWACCLIGSETYDYYNRYMGMPVRPVRVQK